MESLAEKGYLSGYDDGTMRPENSITAGETLALLSRFYKLTELQSKTIESDYKDVVSQSVPASLDWAKDEISICLAAGIITQSELKSIELGKVIEKEKLAVFLVRAMKMEKSAATLSTAKLSFADASSITESYKPHIALLFSLGIVTGDTNNNFSPKQSVTRAVVSTMVSRSLDYLEKNSITLSIEAYSGLYQQEGIISSVSGRALSFYGYDGLQRVVSVPLEASVTVNDSAKALSADYVGSSVAIILSDKNIIQVAISSDASAKWLQGIVTSTSVTTEANSVYLLDKDGVETNYTVSNSPDITQSGTAIALSSLTKGFFATMKYENGVITKIIAVSGKTNVKGTISQISFGTTVALKIADSAGTIYSFSFDINKVPEITRGSKTITVDRLQIGDVITASVSSLSVTALSLDDTGISVTGELTAIVNTKTGISWTIKKSDGASATYSVEENATAYSGTTELKLSDIKVGDTVTVTVYGSSIDEVRLDSTSITGANQVTGSILLINTADNLITLLTPSGKLIYISTANLTWIIYADSGSRISLSGLDVNSQVVVYGAYSSSTVFAGRILIILK
jgi:hypothetical protein